MSFSIRRSPFFTLTLFILSVLVKQTYGRIGIAYSPFVREGDDPQTKSYTKADVEVMLKIVEEKGYREITTYGMGVGSNPGIYRENETWRGFSSVVHTAMATAEINRKLNGNPSLAVYLGLWAQNLREEQQTSEIEVGFEMALEANSIFDGTVKGIVFPSLITVKDLLSHSIQESITIVSERARNMGILLGTRISDCSRLKDEDSLQLQNALRLMDFIICQTLPNVHHLIKGPKEYFNTVKRMIDGVKKTVETFSNSAMSINVMLETGWPSGENLERANTNVRDMLQLWTLLENWSQQQPDQHIFMHEAFNNPWKRDDNNIYGEYYGRWKHTQVNDLSKSAYELKRDARRPTTGPSKELIFGVVFGSVLFILLAVMILAVYQRVKRLPGKSKLTEAEIRQFFDGIVTNEVVNEETQQNTWMKTPYNREFELKKDKFCIDKSALLGSGAFGSVYKGRIEGLVDDVAFKMTRADCPVSALRGLLSEIKILLHLGKHENVVCICGAYTVELQNGIVYIATELCLNGSLEKFLRMSKSSSHLTEVKFRYVTVTNPSTLDPQNITDIQLMRWALDIASAMEYISSKNVIHADLATRNVLLTLDLTAKVSDFGLSRKLYEYTEYVKKSQEPLPWRWLSPESLSRLEFSHKTDVWAYAVTLWEIFSLGDIPYPGRTWDLNFVDELERGLRLQRPSRSSEETFEIMTRCWCTEPTNRPDFQIIKDNILTLCIKLQKADEYNKAINGLN